jgi:hypothetical protein
VRISAFGSTTSTKHLHLHPLKEICMEIEDQPKELKETKTFNFRSVLKMVLASILVMIAINFWNRITPEDVLRLIGIPTGFDILNMELPSDIDHFESLRDGKFIRYKTFTGGNSQIDWGKDDDLLIRSGLKPDREVFKRTLKIKYQSILVVNLSVGARYNSKEVAGDFGLVMARISLNGTECAKDNAVFGGGTMCPLYSTVSYMHSLEPGHYSLLAEGIFAGCIDNRDSKMQLMIIRDQPLTYGEYLKMKSEGYRPVSNGFANINPPAKNWLERIFADLILNGEPLKTGAINIESMKKNTESVKLSGPDGRGFGTLPARCEKK